MDKSVLTFPYQYKQIEAGRLVNPLISISIKSSWGWQPLWFLVDSGADVTTLTLSLAKNLGLFYDTNKKTQLFGIGEKNIDAYPGEVFLKLGKDEINTRCYFIDAIESTLLLGRLDIFEKYNILFDSQNQQIVLKSF